MNKVVTNHANVSSNCDSSAERSSGSGLSGAGANGDGICGAGVDSDGSGSSVRDACVARVRVAIGTDDKEGAG